MKSTHHCSISQLVSETKVATLGVQKNMLLAIIFLDLMQIKFDNVIVQMHYYKPVT